jgi:hypothetical protein
MARHSTPRRAEPWSWCGLTLFPHSLERRRASDGCAGAEASPVDQRVEPRSSLHTCGPGFLFPPRRFDASRRLPEAANAVTTWREHTPNRCAPRRPFKPPPKAARASEHSRRRRAAASERCAAGQHVWGRVSTASVAIPPLKPMDGLLGSQKKRPACAGREEFGQS